MSRRRSRLVAVVVAVGVVFGGTACLDPTTGTPPARTATVPPFQAVVATPTAATLYASWRPGCPIPPSALRSIRLKYWGYDGNAHWGELVVRWSVASGVIAVFRRFYLARYQFARIARLEAFGGSDDRSMAANNTSAFNCRRVTGGTSWSEHSYGTAIDVNPVQNPYVSGSTVLPPSGRPWISRAIPVPEVIKATSGWTATFARIGFKWGGLWTSKKDYQHFSLSGR